MSPEEDQKAQAPSFTPSAKEDKKAEVLSEKAQKLIIEKQVKDPFSRTGSLEEDTEEEVVEGGEMVEREELRGLDVFRKIWDYVLSFEENHPWLFFGAISVVIFLIIVSILAPILSSILSSEDEDTTPPPVIEETGKEPTRKSSSSSLQALEKTLNFSDKTAYLGLIRDTVLDLNLALTGTSFLETELLELRRVEIALEYDVQAALLSSGNQTKTFMEYLDTLENLEERVSKNTKKLGQAGEDLKLEIEQASLDKEKAEALLNQALLQGSEDEVANYLEDYIAAKEILNKFRTRLELVSEVSEASLDPLLHLQARIAGLKANRAAILAGIQIVDIDGSGLELIKTGQVADYL